MSAPDREGASPPFGIGWVGYNDVVGGIVVRTCGLNHDMVEPLMDNTDVYRLVYRTLFGTALN